MLKKMGTEKQDYHENKDYTLRSRMIVFEEEVESLIKLMYGEKASVWSYMADSRGQYSEEKTVKLVDQIVNDDRYQRMHVWDYAEQSDKLPFYRNLLYCLLRTYTSNYVEYGGGSRFEYGEPKKISFSDIISAFEEQGQKLLDENTVFFMETLYEIFSQKKICLDVLNQRRKEEQTEEKEETEAQESMEEILAEKYGYDINEIRDIEQRNLEEAERQSVAEKAKVIEAFEAKEHFCHSLEEVVFYLEEKTLSADLLFFEMKELIEGFLFEKKLPVFVDEESYVEVMVQLKKAIRMAQRYAEEQG